MLVAHWCALSWWTATRRERVPPEWNRYRSEVRRGLAAADVVVAPTRAMLDCMQHHHGPLQAGRVVTHGREPSFFPPRAKLGYVMAATRRWNDAHNLGRLDEAAIFVDPDDGPGLTRALRTLIQDATLRCRLAQRSRARALDLSPARMAQGYVEACLLAGMAAAPNELDARGTPVATVSSS